MRESVSGMVNEGQTRMERVKNNMKEMVRRVEENYFQGDRSKMVAFMVGVAILILGISLSMVFYCGSGSKEVYMKENAGEIIENIKDKADEMKENAEKLIENRKDKAEEAKENLSYKTEEVKENAEELLEKMNESVSGTVNYGRED